MQINGSVFTTDSLTDSTWAKPGASPWGMGSPCLLQNALGNSLMLLPWDGVENKLAMGARHP